ncbi:ABC-2 type transport system ATP-binding protein [Ruminiclostridium sufflavum DSM 19573]|uniref:ABC-2 type transport system ATP-binding protein n=1 Tax=Ruminiclostridium sufflavum DSM 19573 TaxID=1121337 RepID=A0A318XKV6_9FIRM|nr:ATP-binding cassette domain-containing protein [Ruminiclostridium sufflavum]PYG87820.1 ABC-2 type transport system ATP-binding protein [Ruminiclostridium sufflavum DSM 19573]
MGLIVENVSKAFGEKLVVNNISFRMKEPGVFGLLGTNGAGKTTTIRMILNIVKKDNGYIKWHDVPTAEQVTNFGYLPEERGLYPKVRVMEQLMYFARLRGISHEKAKKDIAYWLKRLEAEQYTNMTAEKLSKGNQQKIQFIASIIHDPELIFMDEPFSGLDPVNTELFKGVIYELIEKQKYIIMSSHQMSTVEEFCRDILIIKNGNTVLSGSLKAIKHSYGRNNLVVNCEGNITELAEQEGITSFSKNAAGYEFKIKNEEQAYRLLEKILGKRLLLDKFEIREPSLHEIFIEKAGEGK